jgi:hypothetical protein
MIALLNPGCLLGLRHEPLRSGVGFGGWLGWLFDFFIQYERLIETTKLEIERTK